jgi:hypothetical protein
MGCLCAALLVLLQVVSGFDVIDKLSSLPFAKPRDSYYDAPFFAAGAPQHSANVQRSSSTGCALLLLLPPSSCPMSSL